jgi:hypothetical protein
MHQQLVAWVCTAECAAGACGVHVQATAGMYIWMVLYMVFYVCYVAC